jgi:Protein kinase domain
VRHQRQPELGQTFAGYTIESVLGRGGMGTVYLATHERLKRKVALKVLVVELADDSVFRERFIRESQLAASLDDPNIVPIYDADEHDGVLYIAMRYVEGTDLRALLVDKGRLSFERTVNVVEQVASALDAAHASSLVHRDVKPANILLAEPGGKAFLSDFGLAKTSTSERMTRTGSFLGTVDYCSPEQIEGRPLDGRADVYALGCVIHQCLTGRPPFPRESDVAAIKAHLQDPPPRASATRPELPAAVDDVLATALGKEPSDRFATAGALANALRLSSAPSRSTVADVTAPLAGRPPAETLPHPGRAVMAPEAALPPSRPHEERRRRLTLRWVLASITALTAIGVAVAIVVTRGSSPASPSRFGRELAGVVSPLVPAQRGLNGAVAALDTGSDSLSSTQAAAAKLQRAALLAEGKLSALSPPTGGDRAAAKRARSALAKQEAYAGAVLALPTPLTMTAGAARALSERAQQVDLAYRQLDGYAPSPCCPAMPLAAPPAQRFVELVSSGHHTGVGVPTPYTGLFTSVDRLERCNATLEWVYCGAGPSNKSVKLTVGVGATDLGTRPSVDRGGNSMPEGTSFRTPNGKIECASSSRGITCTDLSTGNGFVIGDYQVVVRNGSSQAAPSVGVPTRYSGRFTAVDRLERCYATDQYVVCNAGPSGKAVQVVAGGSATYEGVVGSVDKGGPSMPEGTSFRTPSGAIECGSSSRGITCSDLSTGNGFTIGDYGVHINNGGVTHNY